MTSEERQTSSFVDHGLVNKGSQSESRDRTSAEAKNIPKIILHRYVSLARADML